MPWVIGEDELRFGNGVMKLIADFGLTEPIHCEHDTANRPDIEFKFGKVKEQTTIEGFGITVEADSEEEAEIIVKKRADKLTDILSATSGTFSEWTFQGMQSSGGRVVTEFTFVYAIRIPSNKNARSPQRETGNWPSDLNNVCPVAKSSLIRTAQTDHEIQADAQDSQD